jgi:acylphosphatase
LKSLEIKIFGRVQGVGFRYSARHEAQKLGLFGMVRNESDGSVFARAQGEDEAMQTFLAWCHKGPWLAKVDRVEVREKEAVQEFSEFTIE